MNGYSITCFESATYGLAQPATQEHCENKPASLFRHISLPSVDDVAYQSTQRK